MKGEKKPPERIWLLDFEGPEHATWCDDPSPSGEDHGAIEYVRADVVQSKLDRVTEALEKIAGGKEPGQYLALRQSREIASDALSFIKGGDNG